MLYILVLHSLLIFIINRNHLIVSAEFNSHFANFVEENYGTTFLDALQRTELGDNGSFGGKDTDDEKIEKDPVIFIHGVSDMAGGKMQALAAKFIKRGYKNGELYATTYADGSKNNPLSWADYSMKCEHVKQIRTLILAVRYYTLRDVDIIAYSLGVPIARKAILGGVCVDTKEDLGSPLTAYVDTFVGIAGPNHGIALQIAGISIPGCVIGAIPILPICSKVIGLYSGLCPTESRFLTDINESEHYEGKYVYSVLSKSDNWIGYEVCGQITAKIPGEDSHKTFSSYNHDEIVEKTYDIQIQMIENHSSVDDIELQLEKNSTLALRRKTLNNKKKKQNEEIRSKNQRSSSSKKQKASRTENSSTEESDEEDTEILTNTKNKRNKKRNTEDFDYLSDKYEHPTLPPFNEYSKKIKAAGKFSGSSLFLPLSSGTNDTETMRMSDGSPRKHNHGSSNVISPREWAEGTYGSTREWNYFSRKWYPTNITTTQAGQDWQTTSTSTPTTTTSPTTTLKRIEVTTTAKITTTSQPHIPTSTSSYPRQSLTSKTDGFFPHPHSEKQDLGQGYHTQVRIAFD